MGTDSPQRGASLALSGMAGLSPCIPLSAHSIAAGTPLGAGLPSGQCFDEQEDLILEDNGCPGVHGARLHGPGRAEPFMVTRTGSKEAAISPRQAPTMSRLAAKGVNLATAAATASILLPGPAKSEVPEHNGEPEQRSSGAGSSGAGSSGAVPGVPSPLLACAPSVCVCACACPSSASGAHARPDLCDSTVTGAYARPVVSTAASGAHARPALERSASGAYARPDLCDSTASGAYVRPVV